MFEVKHRNKRTIKAGKREESEEERERDEVKVS